MQSSLALPPAKGLPWRQLCRVFVGFTILVIGGSVRPIPTAGQVQHSGTIVSPNPQLGSSFGREIAATGNVKEGAHEILISAPNEIVGGSTGAGRAYVFYGLGAAPRLRLESPNPENGGRFGAAAAGVGDVDGDGVKDVLVGAPRETVRESGTGRAYLFSGDDGGLLQTFESPKSQRGARFGEDVAGIGDVDGDGIPDVLIGAPEEGINGIEKSGRAYIFSGAEGDPIQVLVSPNTQQEGRFGWAVASLGDLNGDGIPDFSVTAPREAVNEINDAGKAYLISGANAEVLHPLRAPTPLPYDGFGNDIGAVKDVDGDSVSDVVVGADRKSVLGVDVSEPGQAYIFGGANGQVLRTLNSPNAEREGRFGYEVAGAGDMNGDGAGDVIVGARRETVNGVDNAGRSYLYSGTGGLLQALEAPNARSSSQASSRNDNYNQRNLRIRAQHILIRVGRNESQSKVNLARRVATALLDSAKAGANFARLAQRHSEGPSASQGGDLGFFREDQVPESFWEAASSLPDSGDITPRPIRTRFGYHVIRLTNPGVLVERNSSEKGESRGTTFGTAVANVPPGLFVGAPLQNAEGVELAGKIHRYDVGPLAAAREDLEQAGAERLSEKGEQAQDQKKEQQQRGKQQRNQKADQQATGEEETAPSVLVSFLIITLLAGIGYQLRRWAGKQRWYMGVGFVVVLYVPAYVGAIAGFSAFGTPIDIAVQRAPSPAFGGLVLGALFLCASRKLLHGAVRESLSSEKGEEPQDLEAEPDLKVEGTEASNGSVQTEKAEWTIPSRTQVITAIAVFFLATALITALRFGGIGLVGALVETTKMEETEEQKLKTRKVRVDLSGVPSSATVRVPSTFTQANSPSQRAKEELILAAGRSNAAREASYSKVLVRDWTKDLEATTMLSIGQLGSLQGQQSEVTPQEWRAVLEKSKDASDPAFQKRLDSLQSRFEAETDVPGFKMSEPAVMVRNGSLIVYKVVEGKVDGRIARQLTARKIMYDSGYSVFVDIAVSASQGPPLDSLRNYVRATSLSAE